MIGTIFHEVVYLPIYNALVYFVDIIPSHDMGVAVIVVTILVRLILFPIASRAIKSQLAMKRVAPEIEEIKKKYKEPNEQTKAVFALYRERGIRPFSGMLMLLIQFPVLFGLYWVFARGGFPVVKLEYLYSFVPAPAEVNMHFLGLIDIAKRSFVLALLATCTQFVYTRLSMGARGSATPLESVESSFSTDMAKSFDIQARYVLPLVVGVIGFSFPAVVPLYMLTANVFMVAQEYLSGRRF
jgi:YidC/Oxa1 family membrane protein insertase